MVPFDSSLLKDRYNIVFEEVTGTESTEGFALDKEDHFVRMLNRFSEGLNISDKRVIGSLLIKRYSTIIAGALYLWAHRQAGLDLSLDKVRVTLSGIGLSFHISNPVEFEPSRAVDDINRKNELYLGHLLSANVSPLFAKTVQYTGIRESHLWSNLSYLLAYWRKEWIREAAACEIGSRIENVYRLVTEHYSPDWFPGHSANPIISRFRSIDDPLNEGRSILLRDKCCLNYRLPGNDRYCYTCPLISDEKRIDKYMAIHEKDHTPVVLGKP